jgi:hypothetical protein
MANLAMLLMVRYFCSFSMTEGEDSHANNGQRHQE